MNTEKKGKFEIELIVDGIRIPANYFVQEVFGAGIEGMVRALKGVDDPKRIEITIVRNDTNDAN